MCGGSKYLVAHPRNSGFQAELYFTPVDKVDIAPNVNPGITIVD